MRALFASLRRMLSPGSAVVLGLALVSSVVVWRMQTAAPTGMRFWVFARTHYDTYQRTLPIWNAAHPDHPMILSHLDGGALERRMLSGFLAGTPLADVFEAERSVAARAFVGPLSSVGFLDVTDRLRDEGLMEQINTPSFSPWTNRGRIFGIPHDVHPVMLAYRADLVEAAGIDVSRIETWDDYFRLLRPLQQDFDGDGRPDRWLLNAWDTNAETTQMLFYQTGGSYFDQDGRPDLNNPRTAKFLARLVTWFAGPERVCTDIDMFSALGHKEQLDGVVVGSLVADWMAGAWRIEIPGLAGKVKLMPLPAWNPGGRRTSVWGGTMLAINRRTPQPGLAWEFAKNLYLSSANAEALFRKTMIISPVKSLWTLPCYAEADPYFSGQPVGRLFIGLAPDVPLRPSSPYADMARQRLTSAAIALRAYADDHQIYTAAALRPEAQRLLDIGQSQLAREIGRNAFLSPEEAP